MIGWLILGLVLSVLIVALFSNIKVHLEIKKDAEPVISAKYLGIQLVKFSEEKTAEDVNNQDKKSESKKNKLNLKKYIKTSFSKKNALFSYTFC